MHDLNRDEDLVEQIAPSPSSDLGKRTTASLRSRSHAQDVALAMDVAAGLGSELIRIKHRFDAQGDLSKYLSQPHMESLLEEKKAELHNTAVSLQAKVLLNSHAILDNVISVALDPSHPKFDRCAFFTLDRVLPEAPKQINANIEHTVSAEVVGQIAVGLADLRKSGFTSTTTVADPPHLRSGSDVIAERDRAGLPNTDSSK